MTINKLSNIYVELIEAGLPIYDLISLENIFLKRELTQNEQTLLNEIIGSHRNDDFSEPTSEDRIQALESALLEIIMGVYNV